MAKPDSVSLPAVLIAEGWRTPNTYSRHFEELPSSAGIYLFLVYGDVTAAPVVAYVGKSICLERRLIGHSILRAINDEAPGVYVQKWFLSLPADEIDAAEVKAIRRFDPPFNLQHRLKGLRK